MAKTIGCHRCHGYLARHDIAYHSAFLHDMIVKRVHGILPAVHFWRSTVLWFRRNAVIAEANDAVYVELLHAVTLLLLVLFQRRQKRRKIAHQIKREGCCLCFEQNFSTHSFSSREFG